MSASILYRSGNRSDLPEMISVFKRSILETVQTAYSPEQLSVWVAFADDEELWTERLRNQRILVAEEENTIIGFGTIDGSYIDFLYVLPEHQGRGIGTQLLQTLLNEAQHSFCLFTTDASEMAKTAFEHLGFRVTRRNDFERKGVWIHNYRMTLEVH
ncbi:MAG: GNAT family N-acetyltransferase [Flavobacteriales bacterium]|nr:GNAT family N-acetyltransferase [Flavobacteriales bacterium]